MRTVEQDEAVLHPPSAPETLDASGLKIGLLVQLALKTMLFAGDLTGTELASRLGLTFPVIAPALELLKTERHCEIAGGAIVGGASYRYRITDAGRTRAALFLEQNHYVGHAPVPFDQYRRYMQAFRGSSPRANREAVRRAFGHLVLSQRVLDQLGPAVNAGHSMFIYGPPGNGKTVISQAIRNLLDGEVAIPHALEVEGNIIRLFDPVAHEPLPQRESPSWLDAGTRDDERWVRCRRPMVTVGGELTLDQLDLRFNASAGFYRAPVQATANGGVLVIDDFGRQACSPRDLLNRWIVPLENRVDFLTLQTGQKVDFPFSVMVVFATNMNPTELLDEAFIRRIQYKVLAESPTLPEFMQIFENCCRDRDVEYRPAVVQGLVDSYFRPRHLELRGCQPRDLLDQALSLAQYLERPFELSADLLEAACASYFVHDGPPPARAS
jgi:predicted ATPase with chaperone activity